MEVLNWWAVIPLIIAGWLGFRLKLENPTTQFPPTGPQDDLPERLQVVGSDWTTPQDCFQRDPQFWLSYGSGPGVVVTGWPSQGGVYILDASSRVEIEFMHLDPFSNTRRPTNSDPEWERKENAHCDRSK